MPDPVVPDATVKPDNPLVPDVYTPPPLPETSDEDKIRRAFATVAGRPTTQPLGPSANTIFNDTVGGARSLERYNTQNDMPDELTLALTRYIPISPPPPFTPRSQQSLPLKENPQTGTFGQGVMSGFMKDTLLGTMMERAELKSQVEAAMGPIKPVRGYSAFDDPQVRDHPVLSLLPWLFHDSQSPQESALRIRQFEQRQWDNHEAANSSTAFGIGRVLGGFTDPTLLLTSELGLSAKTVAAMKAAGHAPIWGRMARGIELGSINAVQALAVEATRGELDASYQAPGISDMLMIAGGLGFAVGALTKASPRLDLIGSGPAAGRWEGGGYFQKLLSSAPAVPMTTVDGITVRTMMPNSVGAHATPYMAASHYLQALEGEGLKSIFGLEKFGLNPVMRGLISSSLLVREVMAQLADLGGLKQNKNVDGFLTRSQKTAFPVEAETAVRWKSLAATTEQEIRSAWLQSRTALSAEASKDVGPFLKEQVTSWLSSDGRLSFHDFDQRIGRAVANGNVDMVKDAYSKYVERAAGHVDNLLKEHKKHADELGMFKRAWDKQIKETRMELAATIKRGGEESRVAQLEARLEKMVKLSEHGPQVNTGPNFFPRMYRHDEMAAREGEFLAQVETWMRRGGMAEADAAQAAKAVHAEITLSNFRPIVEDNGALIKAASDPGSLKFRTLEIPDDQIEGFLDWSALGAVRHQTATMAPAIELTRRYGDASMSEVLADIQREYEGLIAKARSGTERVNLQNEMKQSLEDVQAIRDRLLNVAGASKDPHSWNERTIRMLKHYTAWTTLGLSAVSQLGDLFRPAITEGLDAVHRYGFLSLMDKSRAEILRMVQRERMMSGDGMELATGASSLSFANIGDTYHSRSAMERRANQLSGAYFMLNGLTWTTDLTKQWGGLVIQGNLNHEIMAWAKAYKAELGLIEPLSLDPMDIMAGRNSKLVSASDNAEGQSLFKLELKHTEDFDRFMTGNTLMDAEGRPLGMFHGAHDVFGEFDPKLSGSRFGTTGDNQPLFHFITNPELASNYAEDASMLTPEGMQAVAKTTPNVHKVYLRATNPVDITALLDEAIREHPDFRMPTGPDDIAGHTNILRIKNEVMPDIVDYAKGEGHDALIATTPDGAGQEVIVFDKSQIRALDQRYDVPKPKGPEVRHTADFDQFQEGNAVKDRDGNPLMLFHATYGVYDEFENEKLGSFTGAKSAKMGHFFAGNPQTSNAYVPIVPSAEKPSLLDWMDQIQHRVRTMLAGGYVQGVANQKVRQWLNEEPARKAGGAANMRPSYIRMTNPLEVTDIEVGTMKAADVANGTVQVGLDGVSWVANEGKWERPFQVHDFPRAQGRGVRDSITIEGPDGTARTMAASEGQLWDGKPGFLPFEKDVNGESWMVSKEKDGSLVWRQFSESDDSYKKRWLAQPGNNPDEITYTAKDNNRRNLFYSEIVEKAKAAGHDGVIIRNTYDAGWADRVLDDIYVVFDPKTQIRGFDQRWDISAHDKSIKAHMEGTAGGDGVRDMQVRDQAANAAAPPRRPSTLMLERLHSLSIDANDALAIAEMLETHGKGFKSIHLANSDEWTDKDAQLLYRGMLNRALARTVITPGIMDRPTWMTTSMGSLLGQFKTFGVSSTIRTLYAGLQDNDRNFWTGAAVLTGGGVVLNELRNQLFYDKSTFDQPYLGILADGLDRSGVLGSIMDVNNAVETVTNNKAGLRPLVGAGSNMPVTPQKFAGTFFGPAGGKVAQAGKTLGEIVSGNADARTWRDMRGFVPGHNIPYIDPIADMAFPKPPPRRPVNKKQLSPSVTEPVL